MQKRQSNSEIGSRLPKSRQWSYYSRLPVRACTKHLVKRCMLDAVPTMQAAPRKPLVSKENQNSTLGKIGLGSPKLATYFRNRSPMACFITEPPTSEMERVSGMSLGQISTQFCA